MFDALGNVLGNAHFEAYVGGPLVGCLVGVIFAGLGKRPPDHRNNLQSPLDVQDQLHKRPRRAREIHHHYYGSQSSSQSDNGGVLAGGVVVLFLLGFLFSAFLPLIANALSFFIIAVAMFSITASVLAVLTGQFNNRYWVLHAIFPSLVAVGCFWLTNMAYHAINPAVVGFAHDLLGEGPLTLSMVIGGAIAFFKALHNDYVSWILLDMLAFLCIVFCVGIAVLQCVFYVALSNTRSSNSSAWLNLVFLTQRFSSIRYTVSVLVFFCAGWALSSGKVFQFLH